MPAVCLGCQWSAVIPVSGDDFDGALTTVFRSALARHNRESVACDNTDISVNENDVQAAFV